MFPFCVPQSQSKYSHVVELKYIPFSEQKLLSGQKTFIALNPGKAKTSFFP